MPYVRDLGLFVAIGQSGARLRPGCAVVITPEYGGAIPIASRARVKRSIIGADNVMDGPRLTERTANPPLLAGRVTVEDEGAFFGAHEKFDAFAHALTLDQGGERAKRQRRANELRTSGRVDRSAPRIELAMAM